MDSVPVDEDAPTTTDADAGDRPWELRLRQALVDAARARLERQRCSGRDGHA